MPDHAPGVADHTPDPAAELFELRERVDVAEGKIAAIEAHLAFDATGQAGDRGNQTPPPVPSPFAAPSGGLAG